METLLFHLRDNLAYMARGTENVLDNPIVYSTNDAVSRSPLRMKIELSLLEPAGSPTQLSPIELATILKKSSAVYGQPSGGHPTTSPIT